MAVREPTRESSDRVGAGSSDPRDVFRHAVSIAVLAPSGHNTQPWRFVIHGDRLELWADRSRGLPVVDPDDRELVMSCGAALAYLRLALENAGFVTAVDVLPEDPAADLLAVLTLPDRLDDAGTRADELEAMRARRTNRSAYEDRRVPDEVLTEMQAQAALAGAWLRSVPAGPAREALADLIGEGGRTQMADRAFRRELASWLRHNRSPAGDGIRAHAFGIPGPLSRLGPFMIRTFDQGKRLAAKDRSLVLAASLVVVLGTPEDTTHDGIAAGETLARVLLTATRAGVSAAFMNQPVELAALRPRLAALLGTDAAPQLVLRMGYAPEVPPQPRRPLDDVLTTVPES